MSRLAFMVALIVVVVVVADACPAADSCERRCRENAACQQAFVSEGVAPAGSFDGGICNGLCSALRTQLRTSAALDKSLGGVSGDHPCVPPPRK